MKIEIKDYQIIKHASLDVQGITFLVGKTNQGKSAVVRAIEACLFNQSGDGFIRHGQSSAQVGIYFPPEEGRDQLIVAWSKGKGGAKYDVNGVSYQKLGRGGIPPKLAEEGLREIRIGDKKQRLIFWRQIEDPFLLFLTPSQVFDTISSILEERKLLPVLKTMSMDQKKIREESLFIEGKIESTGEQIVVTEGQLERLNVLDDIEPKVTALVEKREKLKSLLTLGEQLVGIDRALADIYHSHDLVLGQVSQLDPILTKFTEKWERFLNLRTYRLDIIGSRRAIEQLDFRIDLLRPVADITERVAKFPISRLLELCALLKTGQKVGHRINELDAEIVSKKREVGDVGSQYDSLKEEIGVCPVCETPFAPSPVGSS